MTAVSKNVYTENLNEILEILIKHAKEQSKMKSADVKSNTYIEFDVDFDFDDYSCCFK